MIWNLSSCSTGNSANAVAVNSEHRWSEIGTSDPQFSTMQGAYVAKVEDVKVAESPNSETFSRFIVISKCSICTCKSDNSGMNECKCSQGCAPLFSYCRLRDSRETPLRRTLRRTVTLSLPKSAPNAHQLLNMEFKKIKWGMIWVPWHNLLINFKENDSSNVIWKKSMEIARRGVRTRALPVPRTWIMPTLASPYTYTRLHAE